VGGTEIEEPANGLGKSTWERVIPFFLLKKSKTRTTSGIWRNSV